MLFRKPPIWNLQPGLVARPWREHWRGVKAVFPFWEPGGRSIYPVPRSDRWSLNNGAVRALTRYGPAVYFPGSTGNEVETADGNPIVFEAGEPYTIALLILWTEAPGNEGIFRSGSANTGSWLWMLSGGKLWGRQANVNSPASGSGPLITPGWHTLARVWDGQQVRQYVDAPAHQRHRRDRHRQLAPLPVRLSVHRRRDARRGLCTVLRRLRRSVGRRHGRPLERQSARHALA